MQGKSLKKIILKLVFGPAVYCILNERNKSSFLNQYFDALSLFNVFFLSVCIVLSSSLYWRSYLGRRLKKERK